MDISRVLIIMGRVPDLNWGTVIVGVVPAIVTWFVARTDTKGNIQSKQVESKATTESLYIEHMKTLLGEYKEQTDGMRAEMESLRRDNADVIRQLGNLQSEFNEFRTSHDSKIQEYKNALMQKQDRIEDLKTEVLNLVEENERLKEELHGHST